jgi:hypothetical protein
MRPIHLFLGRAPRVLELTLMALPAEYLSMFMKAPDYEGSLKTVFRSVRWDVEDRVFRVFCDIIDPYVRWGADLKMQLPILVVAQDAVKDSCLAALLHPETIPRSVLQSAVRSLNNSRGV